MSFSEGENTCVSLEIKTEDGIKKLVLTVDKEAGKICKKLDEEGVSSSTYDLF